MSFVSGSWSPRPVILEAAFPNARKSARRDLVCCQLANASSPCSQPSLGASRADNSLRLEKSGWFHTGDQGVPDEDGYLTITGRLKEIINRGGEKISPAEVDDVLMDHPAIQQAVTFAMPTISSARRLRRQSFVNRNR